jgi:hypothetical protein
MSNQKDEKEIEELEQQDIIPKQSKNIWKHSKFDGMIPITNFLSGIEEQEKDQKKIGFKNEKVKGIKDKDNTTKITIFRGNKMDDTLINHSELLDKCKLKTDEDQKPEKKEEDEEED